MILMSSDIRSQGTSKSNYIRKSSKFETVKRISGQEGEFVSSMWYQKSGCHVCKAPVILVQSVLNMALPSIQEKGQLLSLEVETEFTGRSLIFLSDIWKMPILNTAKY